MPSTAEGSRRHRSVERRVSCEVLEKKWDFSSRTLDGGIKVKAKKGSTAGTKESLGPDGSPADLSMARLANRPADRLKVCQGTTPAASQTDPALRVYPGQLISRPFRFSSQKARPVQFCRYLAYTSKNGDCRSSWERYRLTVRTGHHRARSPDQRHQAITHRVLIRNVVGKISCHESFLINKPPDEPGSKRNDNQHAPP